MRTNALFAVSAVYLCTHRKRSVTRNLSPKHTSMLQSHLMRGISQYVPPSVSHMEPLLPQVQGARCAVPTPLSDHSPTPTSNCPPLTAPQGPTQPPSPLPYGGLSLCNRLLILCVYTRLFTVYTLHTLPRLSSVHRTGLYLCLHSRK